MNYGPQRSDSTKLFCELNPVWLKQTQKKGPRQTRSKKSNPKMQNIPRQNSPEQNCPRQNSPK